jgi:xylulokinase
VGTILGIDLGTSGCKLAVLDEDGRFVASASHEVHPVAAADGTVEQDPGDWYEAVLACLRQLQADDVDLGAISAVGVTGQMQGITLVDAACRPIRRSILWNDIRGEEEIVEFQRRVGDRAEETMGVPLARSQTVAKILWLQAHEAEVWARTFKFMHAPNFVIARLTGAMTADTNNLALTGLNDFVRNDWSQELLDLAAVEPSKVPELRPCFEPAGTLTAQAASETGLRAGITGMPAGGDSAAESHSAALAGSDRMLIRLGTAGAMTRVVPFETLDPHRRRGMRDVLPDHVLLGAYTWACAASVRWARSVFYSELPKSEAAYVRMDADASTVSPGSDGLLYFPYLSGEVMPDSGSLAWAKFLGMRSGMERRHFVRAVYEGVSCSLRDVLRQHPQFAAAGEFVVVGGGAKSRLWLTILADVLGHDAIIPRNCDAAVGAALIAGHGAGWFDSSAVADASVRDCERLVPNAERRAMYDDVFERYVERAGGERCS